MGRYFLYAFVALALILSAVYWRRLRAFGLETRKFLREVRVEMQKVAWPTRNDVIGSTIIVLIAIVIFTVIVATTDEVLSKVMDFILGRGGA